MKALRFYQEKGLLKPAAIDPDSGYRYYNVNQITRARTIGKLRSLDFSLVEIESILSASDDAAVLALLQDHKAMMDRRVKEHRRIIKSLSHLIENGLEARKVIQESDIEVVEKQVDEMKIAGIRMKGPYGECGKAFSKIGRRFGRHICGKPFMLIFDEEYRDDDADFEACFPVRKGNENDGISIRTLEGGHCLSVIHRGPYDEVGRSYERIFQYARQNNFQVEAPCREIYIKGPGIIFQGNPENYVTELQMMYGSPE